MTPHPSLPIHAVCVNCGSSSGARPDYVQAAQTLGAALADRGLTLIYGGSDLGLMGAVAESALARGGKVIGIIPTSLHQRVRHPALTTLHVVDTMHERKQMMFTLADAFIALPGGLGTLDEFFELITWAQLGFHHKPCGLLNCAGYYDPLLAFLRQAVSEGFVHKEHVDSVYHESDPDQMLDRMLVG